MIRLYKGNLKSTLVFVSIFTITNNAQAVNLSQLYGGTSTKKDRTIIFNKNDSWTIPDGVTSITVEVTGAGGGALLNGAAGGGGGGSCIKSGAVVLASANGGNGGSVSDTVNINFGADGQTVVSTVDVTPGSTINIFVGGGGAGGSYINGSYYRGGGGGYGPCGVSGNGGSVAGFTGGLGGLNVGGGGGAGATVGSTNYGANGNTSTTVNGANGSSSSSKGGTVDASNSQSTYGGGGGSGGLGSIGGSYSTSSGIPTSYGTTGLVGRNDVDSYASNANGSCNINYKLNPGQGGKVAICGSSNNLVSLFGGGGAGGQVKISW